MPKAREIAVLNTKKKKEDTFDAVGFASLGQLARRGFKIHPLGWSCDHVANTCCIDAEGLSASLVQKRLARSSISRRSIAFETLLSAPFDSTNRLDQVKRAISPHPPRRDKMLSRPSTSLFGRTNPQRGLFYAELSAAVRTPSRYRNILMCIYRVMHFASRQISPLHSVCRAKWDISLSLRLLRYENIFFPFKPRIA